MRVHVVTERLESNRILPRMAKYLTDIGWTVGEQPSQSAEVNYFMNYITWRQHFYNWNDTRIAAYFTHRDQFNKVKTSWWDESCDKMDLCLTTAKCEAEWLPEGRTLFVRPPVEVDRFDITNKPNIGKPVVGVSGFVYGDNRKGEQLIAALAGSPLAKSLELRASGRGWPISTRWYDWDKMHKFYQGLDVLVVPSLYEGVPMPPLEAMACGVQIVIPTGVGLLDDLPNLAGIHRYKTGDAADMIAKVMKAVDTTKVDRKGLRRYILENHTRETWANDHLNCFRHFFGCIPVEKDLPDWKGNSGVYIVAFGEPSRECAKTCISSINKYMPGLPTVLVSTEPLGLETMFIKQPDRDIGGRSAKLMVDDLAPKEWKYVLYLDADTEVVGDISYIFKCLQDGFEFLICKDMSRYATADMMVRPDNRNECEMTWKVLGTDRGAFQYNGGMMAYRRNLRTKRFFKLWQEEWQRWAKRDQAALLRALYKQPLRMNLLMNQWNASDRYDYPPGKLAILHHNTQARRHTGIVQGRLDSKEAWEAVKKWEAGHREKI